MKTFILSFFIMALAQAKDYTFSCKLSRNFDGYETQLELDQGESNVLVGEIEDFRIYLSSKGNGLIELQASNLIDPARSYASTRLSENTLVELSLWTREYLIEASCRRI